MFISLLELNCLIWSSMNKMLRFLLFAFLVTWVNAQSSNLRYLINFTGTGNNSLVDKVIVENLTKGSSVTLNSNETLVLTDLINSIDQLQDKGDVVLIKVDNTGRYQLNLNSDVSDDMNFSIISVDGKTLFSNSFFLQAGLNTFEIQLSSGVQILKIQNKSGSYSQKIVGEFCANKTTHVDFIQAISTRKVQKTKDSYGQVNMFFNEGDLLLFKGYSGNDITYVTDTPTGDKVLNFSFVDCHDYDGVHYPVVKIGNAVWMAANLNTTKFRNGDVIPYITSSAQWTSNSSSACANYGFNATQLPIYGKCYNWYAVSDNRNIAPVGWRVPTDNDWTNLCTDLGGDAVIGDKIKLSGADYWGLENTGTNASAFSAAPSGYISSAGTSFYQGLYSGWWSSSLGNTSGKSIYRLISSSNSSMVKNEYLKAGGFSVRCIKNTSPVISTNAVTYILSTGFTSGGVVSDNGGEAITECGLCWSTSTTPTVNGDKKVVTLSGTSFTTNITGLLPQTTYYVRSYAINSIGVSYGNLISITTPLVDPIYDIDGNEYHSVVIGTQTWMQENLRTTRYRNGDAVNYIPESSSWSWTGSGAYSWINNDANTKSIYGAIYNGYTVLDYRNIAPEGWHVPSTSEWQTLIAYLGGETVAGGKMKETGNAHWIAPNTNATNTSGFSALPEGQRHMSTGAYNNLGYNAYYWSSTVYDYYSNDQIILFNNSGNASKSACSNNYGNAIRCIKNTIPTLTTSIASSASVNTAVCGGTVIADNGDAVTESGVCWGTNTMPTVSNSMSAISSGVRTYSTTISGLLPATTYYVRAYAINKQGIAYGSVVSFSTPLP